MSGDKIKYFILFLSGWYCVELSAQGNMDEERDNFYKSCLGHAQVYMTVGASREYCTCYSEKVFKSVETTKKSPSDTLMSAFADSCLIQTKSVYGDLTYSLKWNEKHRQSFLKSCKERLKGSSINAVEYCNCALEKMMLNYPDPQKVQQVSTLEKDKIARDCLIQK